MLHHCDIDLEYLIDTVFIIFNSCFPRTRNRNRHRASSPNPEAQEGELENLLVGSNEGWDDSDGAIQSTPRIVKERQGRGARPMESMKKPLTKTLSNEGSPPSYESHLPAPPSPGPSTYSRRTRPVSGYSEFEHEIDEDARSLSINSAKLAEMARQFEPTLTLEDIRREEAEQAERERISEENEVIGSRGRGRGGNEVNGDEEEFGDFEQGEQTEVQNGLTADEYDGDPLRS